MIPLGFVAQRTATPVPVLEARNLSADQLVAAPSQTAGITVTPIAVETPPQILVQPNHTVVAGSPYSLPLVANEPVNWSIGGEDAELWNLGNDTLDAVSFDFNAPADVGEDNVNNLILYAESIATGLITELALVFTIIETAVLFNFDLSSNTVSSDAPDGTVIGTLTSLGSIFPPDFTLEPNTISTDAPDGTVIGELV